MRRTQIYLDEEQAADLQHRAAIDGTTRSAIIREAIAAYLAIPPSQDARLRAFRTALNRTIGVVGARDGRDGQDPLLRRRDRTRDEELEAQWRR